MSISSECSSSLSSSIISTIASRPFAKLSDNTQDTTELDFKKKCFNCQKLDLSNNLKFKHNIFPIRIFLDHKSCFYFRQYQNNLLPVFSGTNTKPTARMKYHTQSKKLVCNTIISADFMNINLFKRFYSCGTACHHFRVKPLFYSETIKSKCKVFSQKNSKRYETTGTQEKMLER